MVTLGYAIANPTYNNYYNNYESQGGFGLNQLFQKRISWTAYTKKDENINQKRWKY